MKVTEFPHLMSLMLKLMKHPHGIPKHATPGEYARATGLEALFGALYLSGQTARIEALFAAMMEEDHAI